MTRVRAWCSGCRVVVARAGAGYTTHLAAQSVIRGAEHE